MLETKPLSTTQYNVMMSNFKEYMVVGGMPAIVNKFVTQKNYSGILGMQKQTLLEYVGTVEWLDNAEIYCMEQPEFQLCGNYNPDNYRLHLANIESLIGYLDEEAQDNLRKNENFNTYKGAIYENVVGNILVKSEV